MMRLPLFIPIIGLIYLVEVLSVMIQVTYFKKPVENVFSKWHRSIIILNCAAGLKQG